MKNRQEREMDATSMRPAPGHFIVCGLYAVVSYILHGYKIRSSRDRVSPTLSHTHVPIEMRLWGTNPTRVHPVCVFIHATTTGFSGVTRRALGWQQPRLFFKSFTSMCVCVCVCKALSLVKVLELLLACAGYDDDDGALECWAAAATTAKRRCTTQK
jgi:hypothetical protein